MISRARMKIETEFDQYAESGKLAAFCWRGSSSSPPTPMSPRT